MGEQGAPHHTLPEPNCPDLRSGDLIDTLSLKGNLSASPDGPDSLTCTYCKD